MGEDTNKQRKRGKQTGRKRGKVGRERATPANTTEDTTMQTEKHIEANKQRGKQRSKMVQLGDNGAGKTERRLHKVALVTIRRNQKREVSPPETTKNRAATRSTDTYTPNNETETHLGTTTGHNTEGGRECMYVGAVEKRGKPQHTSAVAIVARENGKM